MEGNVCINDITSVTNEYCGEWAGATIVRLPMWGNVIEDFEVFNFEWPTQDDWTAMDPRV